MRQEQRKILLVDDDQDVLDIHAIILSSNGYLTECATNGQEALNLVNSDPRAYAMVVTDVMMPVVNGYEFCTQLKANPSTAHIPVLFVSANTDLDEILKGYAIGGFDYITKPAQEHVMIQKIKNSLNSQLQLKLLNEQLNESQTITKSAITFSSELGAVIEFYKNIMQLGSYDAVATQVSEVCTTLSLVSTLQIYTPERTLNFSSQKSVTPLELNVIELSRNSGRLYEFGTKLIINFSNFSLLLKNMPVGDDEKSGRYRDILAMIANGLEAKIEQLNNDVLLQKKTEIMKSIKSSLEDIEHTFQDLQKENINAIEDLSSELNESMLRLGLMEYQEELLYDIAKRCLDRTHQAFFKGISINQSLENIQSQFSYALNKRHY